MPARAHRYYRRPTLFKGLTRTVRKISDSLNAISVWIARTGLCCLFSTSHAIHTCQGCRAGRSPSIRVRPSATTSASSSRCPTTAASSAQSPMARSKSPPAAPRAGPPPDGCTRRPLHALAVNAAPPIGRRPPRPRSHLALCSGCCSVGPVGGVAVSDLGVAGVVGQGLDVGVAVVAVLGRAVAVALDLRQALTPGG